MQSQEVPRTEHQLQPAPIAWRVFDGKPGARKERLQSLLADFSRSHAWLSKPCRAMPRAGASIRSLPPRGRGDTRFGGRRNDLLHVDAFPNRPTNGHRILRLFVNINPSDPRVWVTSDNFARLLERYGSEVGLPTSTRPTWKTWLRGEIVRMFRPGTRPQTAYDEFMLRFHNFLKAHATFQERCFKRIWNFQPGQTWLVLTDTCSHAVLRGRFALENSYFIAPETLALPDESAAALLARAAGVSVLAKAAA